MIGDTQSVNKNQVLLCIESLHRMDSIHNKWGVFNPDLASDSIRNCTEVPLYSQEDKADGMSFGKIFKRMNYPQQYHG